jgi:zinc and cadmium transporter
MSVSSLLQIIFYCLIGGAASLVGALLIIYFKKRSGILSDKLTSFAAGVLITVAVLDLLPEAFGAAPDIKVAAWSVLGGILLVFLMEKSGLWFHHHDGTHGSRPPISGIFWGDALHNFIDGFAIGAAFLLSKEAGIITAVAVGLHELPKEMADFTIYLRSGYSNLKTVLLNLTSSLVAVLGGVSVYLSRGWMTNYEGYLLAMTAGMFLFIALADLIPEMHESMEEADGKNKIVWLMIFAAGLSVGILTTTVLR